MNTNIKWPCHGVIAERARDYADASQGHTLGYAGWDQGFYTHHRILLGRFGQEWLQAFCVLNGLACEADDTDEKTPDKFDLKIGGRIVDVKASLNPTLWPQVGAHLKGKAEFYVFIRSDKQLSWVEFQGWESQGGVFRAPNFVAFGRPLPPDGEMTQRFEGGSYLVPPEGLRPAETLLSEFGADAGGGESSVAGAQEFERSLAPARLFRKAKAASPINNPRVHSADDLAYFGQNHALFSQDFVAGVIAASAPDPRNARSQRDVRDGVSADDAIYFARNPHLRRAMGGL